MHMRSKLVMLGIIVVGVPMLAILGWLVSTTSSSSTISAQEMLQQGQANNATVKTYKLTMDARQAPRVEGGPELYETSIEAIVVFSEGMHLSIAANGEYSEILFLDGKQYSRDSDSAHWEESPSDFRPSQLLMLDPEKHFQLVDDLIDLSHQGEELVDGVLTNKIVGRIDMVERAWKIWGDDVPEGTIEPRAQMLAGTETFTGWVGVEDGLIHAYEASASFPATGELLEYQYWLRVEFSEFNEPLMLPTVE